jgi:P-type Ca2+ transporter type 2C
MCATVRPITASGLTGPEAARRLAVHGPNLVRVDRGRGVVWRAGRQLSDPMLLLLMAAAGLTTWQRDIADTAVIVLVIVVNTGVGVAQELRAERAIAALRDMAAPRARVLRDGALTTVPATEVVPGDVVVLEAGDVVPADATVVEAHQVLIDESAITGESVGVAKEARDGLQAGTTLTRGRATAEVTGTGENSTLGRIAALVASARPGPTPLQQRLTRLGRQLTVAAIAASCIVMALGLLRGLSWSDAALTAASLAVAAVPESLPAVLTLSLALGARRMAQRAAIARELKAVETLGSVTLLATDKTGTLTENRMVVVAAWTPRSEYEVIGTGYAPAGVVVPVGPPSVDTTIGEVTSLGRDAALCNDADVSEDPDHPGQWRSLGDPTEAALVAFAARAGVDVAEVRRDWPRLAEIPFDSARSWMLTEHGQRDDPDAAAAGSPGRLVVVKGAPGVVLARCAARGDADRALAWAGRQSARGRRVLAVAEAHCRQESADELPERLCLVGVVAMTDPPRVGVDIVVERLASAGIGLVVMTGDAPMTAASIAEQVGLPGRVVDASLAGTDFADDEAAVYARVRPEHKLSLVRRWQARGDVVAVTGDGVNDGPALRMADIGVAMGQGGTEVARQAADLVLTDDRLETVVHAVEEGRRIHDNLRRFLGYALSGGLAEVLYVLLAPFLGFAVPLLPGQILWINMLTHGLPGVALGAEPAAEGTLNRPPVPPSAPVVDGRLAGRIGVTGLMIATVTTTAALVARRMDADWQTAAFLVLGIAQLGVALALRDRGATGSNWFLTVAVAVALLLQGAAVAVPGLRALLETEVLPTGTWVACVALATAPGLVLRLSRAWTSASPARASRTVPLGTLDPDPRGRRR